MTDLINHITSKMREFSCTSDVYDPDLKIIEDLGFDGDDFSALALELEKEFGVRPDRTCYNRVYTIRDWAILIENALSESDFREDCRGQNTN